MAETTIKPEAGMTISANGRRGVADVLDDAVEEAPTDHHLDEIAEMIEQAQRARGRPRIHSATALQSMFAPRNAPAPRFAR